MPISITRAEESHLERLVVLFDAYRSFYGQESDRAATRHFLADRIKKGDSVLFVAVDVKTENLCGFAQLYPSYSSVALRRIWILNDLFVSEESRRTGIGQQLMAAVAELARTTQAARVDLATARENASAKKLYESNAYRIDDVFDHYKLVVE